MLRGDAALHGVYGSSLFVFQSVAGVRVRRDFSTVQTGCVVQQDGKAVVVGLVFEMGVFDGVVGPGETFGVRLFAVEDGCGPVVAADDVALLAVKPVYAGAARG